MGTRISTFSPPQDRPSADNYSEIYISHLGQATYNRCVFLLGQCQVGGRWSIAYLPPAPSPGPSSSARPQPHPARRRQEDPADAKSARLIEGGRSRVRISGFVRADRSQVDGRTMGALPLTEGHVDLWYVFPERVSHPGLLARYQRLISQDEAARWRRLIFEKDRHRFLVARAMLRAVLSEYLERGPQELVFRYNRYGKPSLADPSGLPIRFNLSHTAGLAICGVTCRRDLGVDVENLDRGGKLDLARRYFAESESAALEGMGEEEQPAAFYRLWTLKEAYIKARGRGLSIPLGEFAFLLSAGRPPSIRFAPGLDDDPAGWQFAEILLGGRHQIALALRWPRNQTLTIRMRETVPLDRSGRTAVLAPSRSHRWVL